VRLKSSIAASFLPLLLLFVPTVFADPGVEALAREAVSEDIGVADQAIGKLRSLGPTGLNALFAVHGKAINEQISNPLLAATPQWQRLARALDAVSQQKDSYLSGLFWHTDFGQAKAAARASGKPILSLHLLGKLSQEYSCANSRFFRTILYSNEEVSKLLREKFVLHWESERPAPRVTIDFGDGRKLERTLTGNSIHYILDSDGRPLDALPGLYGPGAFLRALVQTQDAFKQSERIAGNPTSFGLPPGYPRLRLNAINVAWLADTEKIGGKPPTGFTVRRNTDGTPQALEIAWLATLKAITEVSILKSMTASSEAMGAMTDETAWNKIAQLHLADAELDARSLGLIQRQTRKALSVDTTGNAEKTFCALVDKLQRNIALDTVRNEYLMHTKLYAWLINDPSRKDIAQLNRKVYAELFLTPASDPWLGLFSADTYTALENGGVASTLR
jgi:hypothetical protein